LPERLSRVLIIFDTSQQVLRGITRYNQLHGPWEFYHQLPYYREQLTWSGQLKRMQQFNPDGIIAHLNTEKQVQDLREIAAPNTPTIISLFGGEAVTSVTGIMTNDEQIATLAGDHFYERGFRNFAYCGLDNIFWSISRQKAYTQYLAEKGYTVNNYQFPKTKKLQLWENEKPLVIDWIKSLPKPVAILACNDDRGREILEACRQGDIMVPEEVAVLGIGDHDLTCELFDPTLSSIISDRQQAGFDAAKALDEMMRGQNDDMGDITIQSHGVRTRRSTDVIAIEDEQVAEALMFIRTNLKSQIQVSDVVDAIAVNRRGLERRFRDHLNRSIHDEIRRVQIDHICLLLRESSMSISNIAIEMGNIDLDSLSRMFRKETGMSPRAYRNKFMP